MYDIILIEKLKKEGLTKSETMDMFDSLNCKEAYPIKIESNSGDSSAMGVISREAAEKLDFDYEKSGLNQYIGDILADINMEDYNGHYLFEGLHIFLLM